MKALQVAPATLMRPGARSEQETPLMDTTTVAPPMQARIAEAERELHSREIFEEAAYELLAAADCFSRAGMRRQALAARNATLRARANLTNLLRPAVVDCDRPGRNGCGCCPACCTEGDDAYDRSVTA